MTKIKFLLELHERLKPLPEKEIEDRLNFYSEMIEDRMEEGFSEEEAVAGIGNIDDIAAQILSDSPKAQAKDEKNDKRRMSGDVTALLILGSPLWVSLVLAAFSVIISLYAALWSLIGSFWAVFGALIGLGFGGVIIGTALTLVEPLPGIAVIASAMVCAGLSIFAFLGCLWATKGAAMLTKASFMLIKRLFSKKEAK